MKLCSDCVHYNKYKKFGWIVWLLTSPRDRYAYPRCNLGKNEEEISSVNGTKIVYERDACYTMRYASYLCGPEAKLFQPKKRCSHEPSPRQ